MRFFKNIFFFQLFINFSQNIDVNNNFKNSLIRNSILSGLDTNYSLNIKPLEYKDFSQLFQNKFYTLLKNNSGTIELKSLGVDYF